MDVSLLFHNCYKLAKSFEVWSILKENKQTNKSFSSFLEKWHLLGVAETLVDRKV